MLDGGLYTPADVAKRLNQAVPTVAQILDFLTRYRFLVQISRHEQLFLKEARGPSPRNVAKIFRAMLEDSQIAR
jgi:hypothetical protein